MVENARGDLISREALLRSVRSYAESKVCSEGLETANNILRTVQVIEAASAVDATQVVHGRWEHVKKHMWHRDEKGQIDMWYLDHGFHNGPGCEICGLSVCEHCEPDWAEQECGIGYFVCSSCGQPTKHGDTAYCPNCGAKMDE